MREEGVSDMNVLDKKDARFQDFRTTLDARMKELVSRGICQANRSVNSRTRGSDGKTYFEYLGAHQKHLLGDFTRGTFSHNRSATFPNRGWSAEMAFSLHITTDEYVPE